MHSRQAFDVCQRAQICQFEAGFTELPPHPHPQCMHLGT